MYNLPRQYVGSFAELSTMDNQLLTSGKITMVGEDVVEVTNGFHNISMRKEEGLVKLAIKSSSQPAVFMTGTVYLPTYDNYRLTNLNVISEGDKRSFFRLRVSDPVEISSSSSSVIDLATMLDLSLGGALLQSTVEYQPHEIINLSLAIKSERLQIHAEILRILPDEGYFRYGVAFTKLPPKDSDILCNYIFQKQKVEINRLKNK